MVAEQNNFDIKEFNLKNILNFLKETFPLNLLKETVHHQL